MWGGTSEALSSTGEKLISGGISRGFRRTARGLVKREALKKRGKATKQTDTRTHTYTKQCQITHRGKEAASRTWNRRKRTERGRDGVSKRSGDEIGEDKVADGRSG